MENEVKEHAEIVSETGEQYSLASFLGIWALAAIPMGILSWIVLGLA